MLGENIAMGYVRKGHAKAGTEIEVETRGKRTAVVSKMPSSRATTIAPRKRDEQDGIDTEDAREDRRRGTARERNTSIV